MASLELKCKYNFPVLSLRDTDFCSDLAALQSHLPPVTKLDVAWWLQKAGERRKLRHTRAVKPPQFFMDVGKWGHRKCGGGSLRGCSRPRERWSSHRWPKAAVVLFHMNYCYYEKNICIMIYMKRRRSKVDVAPSSPLLWCHCKHRQPWKRA